MVSIGTCIARLGTVSILIALLIVCELSELLGALPFLSLGSRDAFVSVTRVSYAAVSCSRIVGALLALACVESSIASSAALFGASFACFFCLLPRVAPDGPAAPWGLGLPWPLIVVEAEEVELAESESVLEHVGSESVSMVGRGTIRRELGR